MDEKKEQEIDIDIRCPITTMIMKRPAIAEDGFIYEKSAIMEWFENHNTSPKTRKVIGKKVIPVFSIKKYIENYVRKHHELKDEVFKSVKTHGKYQKKINTMIEKDDWPSLKKYVGFEFILFSDEQFKKLCRECDDNVMKHIIDHMVDIECENDEKMRPIHYICNGVSKNDMVKYIIDKGVNLEHEDDIKWRAIHFICHRHSSELIKYIIDKGVDTKCVCEYWDVKEEDKDKDNKIYLKWTPLQIMLRYNDKEVIMEAIKYFDKLDRKDIHCLTGNTKLNASDVMGVMSYIHKEEYYVK